MIPWPEAGKRGCDRIRDSLSSDRQLDRRPSSPSRLQLRLALCKGCLSEFVNYSPGTIHRPRAHAERMGDPRAEPCHRPCQMNPTRAAEPLAKSPTLPPVPPGMYCGSCMHDNTLARALMQLGVGRSVGPHVHPDPDRRDDVTIDRVFFGGINVYLQQKSACFRQLPPWLDRFLDRPALLRWIGSRGVQTSARQLGELAVSMLRLGRAFNGKRSARCAGGCAASPARVVVLTNVLVAGCVPD